jgi:hypothetical protein
LPKTLENLGVPGALAVEISPQKYVQNKLKII